MSLPDGQYEVFIDTELKEGHVEIGEAVLCGESKKEILFSSYLCHPSMANNELSGPLVLAFLYEKLKAKTVYRMESFALLSLRDSLVLRTRCDFYKDINISSRRLFAF